MASNTYASGYPSSYANQHSQYYRASVAASTPYRDDAYEKWMKSQTDALNKREASLGDREARLASAQRRLDCEKNALEERRSRLCTDEHKVQQDTAALTVRKRRQDREERTLRENQAEYNERNECLVKAERALQEEKSAFEPRMKALMNQTAELGRRRADVEQWESSAQVIDNALSDRAAKLDTRIAAAEDAARALEEARNAADVLHTSCLQRESALDAGEQRLRQESCAVERKTRLLMDETDMLGKRRVSLEDKEKVFDALLAELEAEQRAFRAVCDEGDQALARRLERSLIERSEKLDAAEAKLRAENDALQSRTQLMMEQADELGCRRASLEAREVIFDVWLAELETEQRTWKVLRDQADSERSDACLRMQAHRESTERLDASLRERAKHQEKAERKIQCEMNDLQARTQSLILANNALGQRRANLEEKAKALDARATELEETQRAYMEERSSGDRRSVQATEVDLHEREAKLEDGERMLRADRAALDLDVKMFMDQVAALGGKGAALEQRERMTHSRVEGSVEHATSCVDNAIPARIESLANDISGLIQPGRRLVETDDRVISNSLSALESRIRGLAGLLGRTD